MLLSLLLSNILAISDLHAARLSSMQVTDKQCAILMDLVEDNIIDIIGSPIIISLHFLSRHYEYHRRLVVCMSQL